MQTFVATVDFHQTLNQDVHHIGMTPEQPLPIAAGQYLEICLDNGWCVPYSVANDPQQSDNLELYIQQLPQGDANLRALHALGEGSEVTLAMAGEVHYQNEWDDAPLVLLAAGCGISQARSLIEARLARSCAQPVYLCWGGGDESELFPLPQLARWSQDKHFLADLTLERPPQDWCHAQGTVVDTALNGLSWMTPRERQAARVVITGSPNMVTATRDTLAQHGFSRQRLLADLDHYKVRTRA